MSNTQARRLTAILVLICVILLTSCGNLFNLLFSDSKEEDVKNTNTKDYGGNTAVEKIIAYMNANYDDTFEYVKTRKKSGKIMEIIMKSEKFPDEEIWGYYNPDGDDKMFLDNYVSIKYRQQTSEKIKVALEELFGEAELIFEEGVPLHFDSSRYRDFTFEEYIADDNNLVYFGVIVDSSYTFESQSDFENAFSKSFIDISCSLGAAITFAADQSLFDQLKNEEITEDYYMYRIRTSSVEHIGVRVNAYTVREDKFEWREYYE